MLWPLVTIPSQSKETISILSRNILLRRKMDRNLDSAFIQEIMLDYSRLTGLTGLASNDVHPRRYLWTDAFAVCNYLELFRQTNDETYRDFALSLVDHRRGWISGLDEKEGERHPTVGGLRIGKQMNERRPDEPPNERLEWDQDGQYYHYLTKWMHALNCVARVTGDPTYTRWAMELAQTAHARFTYATPHGGRKRMYWKMSIDLSDPEVSASRGRSTSSRRLPIWPRSAGALACPQTIHSALAVFSSMPRESPS
jgi:hypothetical protein